jgi:replicative DNA helicase Mcm
MSENQKTNCPECMKGKHFRCRDTDTCLCAESLEHKQDIENSKVAQKTFTDSAICDSFKKYFREHKQIIETIDILWTIKNPTFTFDPTKHTELLDIFLNNEDRYKMALRRAIRETLAQRHPFIATEDTVKFINECNIVFTDSIDVKFADWGPEHLGIPHSSNCVILSLEDPRLQVKSAKAICLGNCGTAIDLEVDPYSGTLQYPPKCDVESCSKYDERLTVPQKTMNMQLHRVIYLQEPMDEAKHGAPVVLEAEIYGDDVKDSFVGQKKRILGVYTAQDEKRQVTKKIVIRAISITDDVTETVLKPEPSLVNAWKAMAKDSESWLDLLVKSYAPELYKDDQTRVAVLAVLMSLVRGTTVDRLRGDIHSLLVGDPSLGKTKILEFLILITQKSAYVNGRMASGPGLTVGMDQTSGGKRVPRVGPVPLCTDGFVAIDELGQTKKDDLSALLQSMESGRITFAKSGYNFTVEARTTIIGAANPVSDSWDDGLNPVDNIGLPKTILSRCDLIVNLRDLKDDITDQKKMNHILRMRRGEKTPGLLGIDDFMRLLNYVRELTPEITNEADKKISDFYNMLRKLDQKAGSRPVDTRLSESLIRISTAIAKLHFSDKVLAEHVDLAIDITKKAFHTLGMKIEEGQTIGDNDTLITSKEQAILKCARKLEAVAGEDGYFPYDDLLNLVIDKEPEQFNEDKAEVEKWIDTNIDKSEDPMFLRKGSNLRLSGRMSAR